MINLKYFFSIFYIENFILYYAMIVDPKIALTFTKNPTKEFLYKLIPKNKIKTYLLNKQVSNNLLLAYDFRNKTGITIMHGSNIIVNNTSYNVVLEYCENGQLRYIDIKPNQRTYKLSHKK